MLLLEPLVWACLLLVPLQRTQESRLAAPVSYKQLVLTLLAAFFGSWRQAAFAL